MRNRYHYFAARRTPTGLTTEGTTACELGYKLPAGANKEPAGVFAEWRWDGQRLTACNDYSGYYPVFYYADADQVMISESLIRLIALGAPAEFDEDALAVFCRCGFFLGERTPFRAIRALPANARFSWHDGHLTLEGGLRLTAPASISPEQAVEGYVERFREAMDRYPPAEGRLAVPLTGGRDSRQILLELHRRGLAPTECVTCGEPRDVRVASQLTERLGLPHRFLAPTCRWTQYMWRKNIVTHLCALEHAWIMLLGDYLASNYEDVYEGSGVGVLTRSELLTPELVGLCDQGRFGQIAVWLFDTVGPGRRFFELLPEPFRFLSRAEQPAIDLVSQELERHAPAANPLTSFNFWNWNRRATALLPFGVERGVARLRTPFMDEDLYDFVSSFTPRLIFEAEPQTGAIRKAYPESADVPFYDEFPKEVAVKSPFFRRCHNWVDKLILAARCCPSSFKTLLAMRSLRRDPSLTGRNRAMQETVLMYLWQLQYGCDKNRAGQMLAQWEGA